MRRILSLSVIAVLIMGLLIWITGCGEDESEDEPARMIGTTPDTGGEMFADGYLTIVFDSPVTTVLVNGTLADVNGAEAIWEGQWLEVGDQALTIEWTDENGNTGSAEIILTINEINPIVCFHPMTMRQLL